MTWCMKIFFIRTYDCVYYITADTNTEEKKEINLKVSAEPAANLRTISEESALERNQETTKKQEKIISLVYRR